MGFKIFINDRNVAEEGHNVYRDVAPMDPLNLPAPYDTTGPDLTVWEDGAVTPGQTYYYRFGAFTANGTVELVSDEIMLEAVQPDYPEVGLVTHYEMDQVVNGELVDLAGDVAGIISGADGEIVVDATLGEVFSADGSQNNATGYITSPSGVNLKTNTLSVALWFKTSNVGDTIYAWSQLGDQERNRGIAITSSGIAAAGRDETASQLTPGFHLTPTLPGADDGNWHLAVFQQEGTVIRLYLDGSANMVETTMPSTLPASSWDDDIVIGATEEQASVGPGFRNGGPALYAAYRAYARIILPSEVDELYAQFSGLL